MRLIPVSRAHELAAIAQLLRFPSTFRRYMGNDRSPASISQIPPRCGKKPDEQGKASERARTRKGEKIEKERSCMTDKRLKEREIQKQVGAAYLQPTCCIARLQSLIERSTDRSRQ